MSTQEQQTKHDGGASVSTAMLGTEDAIRISVHFGRIECRSWLEAEVMIDGGLRLVGMGSRTDYDREGKVVYHKTEPTGLVTHYPGGFNTKPGWIEKMFGA